MPPSAGLKRGFAANAYNQSGAAGKNLTPVSVFTAGSGSSMTVPTAGGSIPLSIAMPATSPTATVGLVAGQLADLQEGQAALEEITGKRSTEALLERIFSRFCVGK